MKRTFTLAHDTTNRRLLVDGVAVDSIVVLEGDTLAFDCSELTRSVWATVDDHDRDLKLTADGTAIYSLPALSTLVGGCLPSEAGAPSFEDEYLMDLSSGILSDLEAHQLSLTTADEIVRVGVIVNGRVLADSERRFEPVDTSVKLILDAAPSTGEQIRVKWRLSPWALTTNGSLMLSPASHERFKTAWICFDDWSVAPIKIQVRIRRGESLAWGSEDLLPRAVKDNSPGMVQLFKDFFDHVSTDGAPFDVLRRLDELRDVDLTTDDMVKRIFAERLPDFPVDSAADIRLLIKLISHFYEARGTEPSFAFLARAIHGETISVNHPQDRIFRGSDADWIQNESIFVTGIAQALAERSSVSSDVFSIFGSTDPESFGTNVDLLALKGNRVSGLKSTAIATVEDVIQTVVPGGIRTELVLSARAGQFLANEIISPVARKGLTNPLNLHCCIGEVVVGVELVGANMPRLGAPIGFGTAPTGTVSPQAFVSFSDGAVVKTEIADCGWLVPSSTTGSAGSASFKVTLGTIVRRKGHWASNVAASSDDYVRVQDGDRFQVYSYEIESDSDVALESRHIRRILHPAGFADFRLLSESPRVGGASISTRGISIKTLRKGQDSVLIGDVGDLDFDVYVGDTRIPRTDLTIVRDTSNPNRNFARLSTPVAKTEAVLVVRRLGIDPVRSTFDSEAESVSLDTPLVMSDPVSDDTRPGFISALVYASLGAQLTGIRHRRYIRMAKTPSNFRSASIGAQWSQTGTVGIVTASCVESTLLWVVVEFATLDEASIFSAFSPITRILR